MARNRIWSCTSTDAALFGPSQESDDGMNCHSWLSETVIGLHTTSLAYFQTPKGIDILTKDILAFPCRPRENNTCQCHKEIHPDSLDGDEYH